jgi:hypothetical protein
MKMKKTISLTLLLAMMFSLMAPSAAFAANTTSDVITKMAPIYEQLTTDEVAVMKAAYDLSADTGTDYKYAAMVLLLSGDVQAKYDAKKGATPGYIVEAALIQFIRSLSMIKHAYITESEDTLTDAMTYFKGISNKPLTPVPTGYSVMDVLFEDVTSDELITLFLNTYSNIGDYVTATNATALATASTSADVLTAAEPIIKAAYNGEAAALGLDTLLKGYGWDGDAIVKLDDEVRLAIGAESSKADIVLMDALIRKEATVVGDITLSVGDIQNYTISLFGNETNLVKLSSESSRVSISGTSVTAEATGTAVVYVHRAGVATPVPAEDYLSSFTITISDAPAGSNNDNDDNTGTTTPPPTTDTVVSNANDIKSESDATKVANQVATIATNLGTTIQTATTLAQKQAAVTQVTSLAQSMVTTAKAITSEAGAKTFMTSTTAMLNSSSEVVKAAATATQVKEVVAGTQALMTSAKTVMNKVTTPSEAQTVAKDMIKAGANVIAAANATTLATGTELKGIQDQAKALKAQVEAISKKAVVIAGTQNISASAVNLNAATGIGSVGVNAADLAAKAQAAASAKTGITQAMNEAGLVASKEIKPQVVINIPQVEGVKTVEASLSGLNDVFAVVDEVKVSTPTASFEIDKNSFSQDLAGTVKVSADDVSVTDLTAAQRAQVPSNAKVIDLNASVGDEKVSTFKKPVTISLPYELKANENPEKLSVYLLKDDGTIEAVPAKYVDGQVVFKRKGFSLYFVEGKNVTFDDLTSTEWARSAVEYLAAKGITSGTSDTTFSPLAKITRAEFLTMLMKIAQLNGDVSALPFDDVDAADWYATSVAAAFDNDIVSGTSSVTFSPNASITRQDMAVMISKVMLSDGYVAANASEVEAFGDASDIATYAVTSVALASREGIVNGTPDGTFNPTANATRAEAAAMLYNLFSLE